MYCHVFYESQCTVQYNTIQYNGHLVYAGYKVLSSGVLHPAFLKTLSVEGFSLAKTAVKGH